MIMANKNPRINVVVEKPLYNTIKFLAKKDNVSLSTKMRDLVIEALEYLEDVSLTKIADKREKSFNKKKALTSKDILPT
jgi:hypothetical protein